MTPRNPYDTPDRYQCVQCGVMVDELEVYFDGLHRAHCPTCKEEIGEGWQPWSSYDA